MRRQKYLEAIKRYLRVHRACGLLGPRQVGKTTLAQMYIAELDAKVAFFDLENPSHLARLANPLLALGELKDQLIVIDEVQRCPELFPVLRVLMDDKEARRKFLILGSASRDLIRQSSETLAGRIGYIEVAPFALDEVDDVSRLWLRGGFPDSYFSANDEDSFLWRQSYTHTFLERDVPNLGFQIPPQQMRRFWLMLAHYHGQLFNASELAKSLAISGHTVRKYLDLLAGTFMVRVLPPWFENLGKRQIKAPKIYFRDSGILHALLGLHTFDDLNHYPRLGSFWEGFALEEIIQKSGAALEECYFWRTHTGAELDLLIIKDGKRIGYEFKYTDRPKVTPSMQTACRDLKLDHLYVVVPGDEKFSLNEQITVMGLTRRSDK